MTACEKPSAYHHHHHHHHPLRGGVSERKLLCFFSVGGSRGPTHSRPQRNCLQLFYYYYGCCWQRFGAICRIRSQSHYRPADFNGFAIVFGGRWSGPGRHRVNGLRTCSTLLFGAAAAVGRMRTRTAQTCDAAEGITLPPLPKQTQRKVER